MEGKTIMKKLIILSLLCCAFSSAHGQNVDLSSYTKLKSFSHNELTNHDQDFAFLQHQLNLTSQHASAQVYSLKSQGNKPEKSTSHFFSAPTETHIQFNAKNGIKYGVGVALEPQSFDQYALRKNETDEQQLQISTSAFINYQLTPNFSLTSAVTLANKGETSYSLSAGGNATTIFNRNHRISAMFNVNWTNQSEMNSSYWHNTEVNQTQNQLRIGNQYHRAELRIGASWNWNLNTNWSLTTGAAMKHTLYSTNAIKNPFSTRPLTIFSVATYRF